MPASKRQDFTQAALDVVRKATTEAISPAPAKKQNSGRKKDAASDQKPKTKLASKRA